MRRYLCGVLLSGCVAAVPAQTAPGWSAAESRPLTARERQALQKTLEALPNALALQGATLRADATRTKGKKGAGPWTMTAELDTAPRLSPRAVCWVDRYSFSNTGDGWKADGGVRHVAWLNRGDDCRSADGKITVGEQVDTALAERIVRDWRQLLGRAVPVIRGFSGCAARQFGNVRLASIAQTDVRDRVEMGFAQPPAPGRQAGYGKILFVSFRIRGADFTPWAADCAGN